MDNPHRARRHATTLALLVRRAAGCSKSFQA